MKKKMLMLIGLVMIATFISMVYDSLSDEQGIYMVYAEDGNMANDIVSARIKYVSPEYITLIFYNNAERNGMFGMWFVLEKLSENEWKAIDTIIHNDNFAFPDIGFGLPPDGTLEHTFNWEWLYGSLESGEYRIRTRFLYARILYPISPEDIGIYYITTNFTI